MREHRPETQTLYAQLFESTAALEVDLLGGFATGLSIEREVRNGTYLYWQLRTTGGRLRQIYLGPSHDPRARDLADALTRYKSTRRPIVEDLERLTAAYVASGGATHFRQHFKIVDALSRAGVFRAGAVLVGSHAFVSIGASLGVSWTAATAATADVDVCRDAFVSVACDGPEALTDAMNVPGILKTVDPSFFLVPELDLKTPSASLSSRSGTKVDFLTTAKTPRDTRPREIAPFGIAARPLRYMDYLVRDDVERGLFVGPHALLVNIPHAGRFALHKLAVATRRAGGEDAIKSDKDRRQAAALILALAEVRPGVLAAAVTAARAHHDKGLLRDIKASLTRVPAEARAATRI